jgi:hypothetical protein
VRVAEHTEDGVTGAPGSPPRPSSDRGEKLPGHLLCSKTRDGVASASVIVSDNVCVPVPVVPNEISKPIGQTGLSDRLAGKSNPQWAGASWDGGSRTITYIAEGVAAVGTVRVVFEEHREMTYNTISFLMFANPLQEGVRREDEGMLVEESRKVGQ